MKADVKLLALTIRADQDFKRKSEIASTVPLINALMLTPPAKTFHARRLELIYLIVQKNLASGLTQGHA